MSMECEKKKAPIGVFDSGVGGLTVVREMSRSSVFSKQNRSKPLSLPAIRQVHWLWMLFGMNLIFQSLV